MSFSSQLMRKTLQDQTQNLLIQHSFPTNCKSEASGEDLFLMLVLRNWHFGSTDILHLYWAFHLTIICFGSGKKALTLWSTFLKNQKAELLLKVPTLIQLSWIYAYLSLYKNKLIGLMPVCQAYRTLQGRQNERENTSVMYSVTYLRGKMACQIFIDSCLYFMLFSSELLHFIGITLPFSQSSTSASQAHCSWNIYVGIS